MLRNGMLVIIILAFVYANQKDVDSNSTTQKTPAVNTRFFGLEGILGGIFQGHHHNPVFGGFGVQHIPYPVQQNPQQEDNWANIRSPQQFPSQGQDFGQQFNPGRASQSQPANQGNLNPGSSLGTGSTQNVNTGGTLDEIPPQNGVQQSPFLQNPNENQMGFQNQNGFQSQNDGNQMGFQNQNAGNQMGFQNQNVGNQMEFQNQQGCDGNDGQVAILGRPVTITPTLVPDRIVFQDGSDTPDQRQCVQDCQSTTEYDPVCASNNITYFNPGRFICARNCGLSVYLRRPGTCFD